MNASFSKILPCNFRILLHIIIVIILSNTSFAQVLAEGNADSEKITQINYIQNSLDEGKYPAYTWWYSWTVFFGATSGLAYTAAFTIYKDNEAKRIDNLITGSKALIGFMAMLRSPAVPLSAPDDLRALPDATPRQRSSKLFYAKSYLQQSADRELRGRSLRTILIRLVINITGSAVIWFDRNIEDDDLRRTTALKSFAWGALAGVLMHFTQPTTAIESWKEYQRKYKNKLTSNAYGRNWFITLYPGIITAGIRF